jgi:galactonate dehydratase
MRSVYETFRGRTADRSRSGGYRKRLHRGKGGVCSHSEPLEGIGKVKRFAALMSKLREAVGDAVEVMIDFHGRTYPAGCVASL